jgi:hypothetical protein
MILFDNWIINTDWEPKELIGSDGRTVSEWIDDNFPEDYLALRDMIARCHA